MQSITSIIPFIRRESLRSPVQNNRHSPLPSVFHLRLQKSRTQAIVEAAIIVLARPLPGVIPNLPLRHQHQTKHRPNMCDWEEFIFGCSCSYTKRKNYCHFARNDPNHQCFGVQVLKKVWDVPEACDKCSTSSSRAAMQAPAGGWGHGYVAQEQSE